MISRYESTKFEKHGSSTWSFPERSSFIAIVSRYELARAWVKDLFFFVLAKLYPRLAMLCNSFSTFQATAPPSLSRFTPSLDTVAVPSLKLTTADHSRTSSIPHRSALNSWPWHHRTKRHGEFFHLPRASPPSGFVINVAVSAVLLHHGDSSPGLVSSSVVFWLELVLLRCRESKSSRNGVITKQKWWIWELLHICSSSSVYLRMDPKTILSVSIYLSF